MYCSKQKYPVRIKSTTTLKSGIEELRQYRREKQWNETTIPRARTELAPGVPVPFRPPYSSAPRGPSGGKRHSQGTQPTPCSQWSPRHGDGGRRWWQCHGAGGLSAIPARHGSGEIPADSSSWRAPSAGSCHLLADPCASSSAAGQDLASPFTAELWSACFYILFHLGTSAASSSFLAPLGRSNGFERRPCCNFLFCPLWLMGVWRGRPGGSRENRRLFKGARLRGGC